MRQRVIIVGGFGSYPEKNWFPWLKRELEALGIAVEVPQMPDSLHPRYEVWLPFLQQVVGNVDENTFLIGHSLGGCTCYKTYQKINVSAA
jgi:predicted alpha/beta hydrolase family esterase